MKIWDVNWGTNTTAEFESKVFVHDTTELLKNMKCAGIEHEVFKLLMRKYVDDMLTSTISIQKALEIKEATDKYLAEYSFETKGWNITGDPFTPNDNNLNEFNKLGTCSYMWNPTTDKFTPKKKYCIMGKEKEEI